MLSSEEYTSAHNRLERAYEELTDKICPFLNDYCTQNCAFFSHGEVDETTGAIILPYCKLAGL